MAVSGQPLKALTQCDEGPVVIAGIDLVSFVNTVTMLGIRTLPAATSRFSQHFSI